MSGLGTKQERPRERQLFNRGFLIRPTASEIVGRNVSETFRKRAHSIHCSGYITYLRLVARVQLLPPNSCWNGLTRDTAPITLRSVTQHFPRFVATRASTKRE